MRDALTVLVVISADPEMLMTWCVPCLRAGSPEIGPQSRCPNSIFHAKEEEKKKICGD